MDKLTTLVANHAICQTIGKTMNPHPQNLPSVIDRDELAKRIKAARADKQLTQQEVVDRIQGMEINKSFLSALEASGVAFTIPEAYTRLKAIVDFLEIDIPYVSSLTRKKKIAAPPSSLQTIEDKIEDAEITAMWICNKTIARLTDPKSQAATIDYLCRRYLGKSVLDAKT